MIQFLSFVLEIILKNFQSMQQESIKFSKTFVCFFLILTSLLNLSYLYEEYQPSYTYICAILTRPQIFLNIEDFDYIVIGIVTLYLIAVLIEQMPFRSYIAVFGEILRVNGLNFCFELCRGKYKLIPQSLLIFLFLNDSFFVQGTLNIQIKNFQLTRNLFTNKILALMMIIQMMLYTNHVNEKIFQIYVTIHSAVLFFHSALNQPYKESKMSLVMACIQFITFYLGILKVANIYTEFTSELLLIPFMAKIIWVNFEKRFQKPSDPNSIEEILIRSSVLIKEQKYFDALKILESKRNIGILIKAKKENLYKSGLKEIQSLIYTNIPSHTKMAEAVNLLMENENVNNKIQSRIMNLLRSKIQQLKKLHDSQFNVFWELMDYTMNTAKIIEELKNYYSAFPSNKTQAILGFVYSEIQNDFIASNKLFSIQALTEENNYQRRIISETFSNKVAYLIAGYKNGLIINERNLLIQFLRRKYSTIFQQVTIITKSGSVNTNSIKQFQLDREEQIDVQLQLQFDEIQGDDQASQISSLQGIRKSKYFKKYEIIDKLNGKKRYSQHHLTFYIFQGLNIILYIILGGIELSEINVNLTNLAVDIDLLQIKNLVFMPTESFLVTRYNILQYSLSFRQKTITPAQYAILAAYPRSNLGLGYDQLSENIHQVLNKRELQQSIKDIQLETYLYINTGEGEIYEMNLRGAINTLLNFQYIVKMAYQIDGSISIDTTSFYYSYRNYKTLKGTFSQLNEQILVQTIDRSQVMQYSVRILFVISLVMHFALIIVLIRSFYQIKMFYQKYVFLIMNIDKHIFDEEITRYQKLVNLLDKDLNILFRYHHNVEQIENFMSQPYSVEGQKRIKIRKSKIQINLVNIRWIAIIILGFVITNCTMTYNDTSQYLSKYPATSKFYKDLSDVGTDIPTMYAQKEIYYLKAGITYFTYDDNQNMIIEVLSALNRTKVFSQNSLDFNQFLISNDFKQYYQEIQQSDLCNYLPESIKNKSLEICPQILSSNMIRGLNSILVYIINSIETEYGINQFQTKLSSPILELEGAFILCQLINDLNKRFNKDLNQLTVDLLANINTYNLILMMVLAIILLGGSIKLKQYFQTQNSNVKKLLYLTPRRTLLTDDAFERNSKALLILT